MGNSVYQINKGINKPVEFKGLKAQYIWYLGGGLVALLILFAIIYIVGINIFICLALIVSLTTALFMNVSNVSFIGKSAALPGIPAQKICASPSVSNLGVTSICVRADEQRFLISFNSSLFSVHASKLK